MKMGILTLRNRDSHAYLVYDVRLRQSKRGEAPLFNYLPLHAKNTSPYYGEGDKGDGVTL